MSKRSACSVLFVCAVAACGGSSAPSPSSPSAGRGEAPAAEREPELEPEPRTVKEAQDRITRAARDIADPERVPTARSEDTKPSSEALREQPQHPQDEGAKKASCAMPCRAIGSMRRAVDALCRMTGDADRACTDAKKTLADNEARVKTCGC